MFELPPRWPYIALVPKTFDANLEFREKIIRLCANNKHAQQEMWKMCKKDFLLFVNCWCWGLEPKAGSFGSFPIKLYPLITYPFQDKAMTQMCDIFGKGMVHIGKSREMSATWICCLLFLWRWLFHSNESFLVTSRKEDLVDKKGDTGCIFAKFDFLLSHLPKWMVPKKRRADMILHNLDNGCVIVGETTNTEAGRGTRHTAFLLDEFAAVPEANRVFTSTYSVSAMRIFNSTPQGAANAFYRIREKCDLRIELHWSQHPLKNQGMYLLPNGKKWSPWREQQKKELLNPQMEAQELEIDYAGSNFPYFAEDLMRPYMNENVAAPIERGELSVDASGNPLNFNKGEFGSLLLWCKLDGAGNPSKEIDLALAADVGPGTGSTPSVLSGINRRTGEKVLEYANNRISEFQFAELAAGICRWFKCPHGLGGKFIWEENGPGLNVTRRLREIRFHNVYYRESENTTGTMTLKTPGWWTDEYNKIELLKEYHHALVGCKIQNHSIEALEECGQYVYHLNTGRVVHAGMADAEGSDAGYNHGDRVIADALAWWIARGFTQIEEAKPKELPLSCFQRRRERYDKQKQEMETSSAW